MKLSLALNVLLLCAVTAQADLRISWADNLLHVDADGLPGGPVEILYLEAFCRTGSTNRDWNNTVLPHTTQIVKSGTGGSTIALETRVDPGVIVHHTLTAHADYVDFELELSNPLSRAVDIDWAQPCIRVGGFTGLGQDDYTKRCFVVTKNGLTILDRMDRNEQARYKGGQVYVPAGINHDDVNPRPISAVAPSENLIGCFSADNEWVLGMAWDQTQELFQGVITCIHSDFRIGGMQPGEKKSLRGRLYVFKGNPEELLERYRADFGSAKN